MYLYIIRCFGSCLGPQAKLTPPALAGHARGPGKRARKSYTHTHTQSDTHFQVY